MYTPQEDSFLLEKQVKKYAHGKVLDMGTGSGIQAVAAAKNTKISSVLAVDIDKEAIDYCIKNIHISKIKFDVSDLFSRIKKNEVFDAIIFNPPYLPEEKEYKNLKIKDRALYGGKFGFEIIERFLKNVKVRLSESGIILMVFSSLTNKEKVDSLIKSRGFEFVELEKQHIFFEDIYVYLIKRVNKNPQRL